MWLLVLLKHEMSVISFLYYVQTVKYQINFKLTIKYFLRDIGLCRILYSFDIEPSVLNSGKLTTNPQLEDEALSMTHWKRILDDRRIMMKI